MCYQVKLLSKISEVKIKDKTYRQYEFKSFRTSSYSFNIPMDILANAKGDKDSYDKYVSLLLKVRQDNKTSQEANFSALQQYALYGEYNSLLNTLGETELLAGSPEMLTDMLKPFAELKHTIMYFGPMDIEPFKELIAKEHKMADEPKNIVAEKKYEIQLTPQNEFFIAPYDAKNIYLMQLHNEGKQWNVESEPLVTLLNEYFGSGMHSIVFQELREARGLAYSASAWYYTPSFQNGGQYPPQEPLRNGLSVLCERVVQF